MGDLAPVCLCWLHPRQLARRLREWVTSSSNIQPSRPPRNPPFPDGAKALKPDDYSALACRAGAEASSAGYFLNISSSLMAHSLYYLPRNHPSLPASQPSISRATLWLQTIFNTLFQRHTNYCSTPSRRKTSTIHCYGLGAGVSRAGART